jgi:hypothetical protein
MTPPIQPPQAGQGDVVDGTVAPVNERGVLLVDEDVWITVATYADSRPNLPRPGDWVRLYLDAQGYLHRIDVLSEDSRCQYAPRLRDAYGR